MLLQKPVKVSQDGSNLEKGVRRKSDTNEQA